MNVQGVPYRTIWAEGGSVKIIDQTRLPHAFVVAELDSLEAAVTAIATMQVRGAPLIGAAAAYGLALAMREDPTDDGLARARERLLATRPTAVNLRWALDRGAEHLAPLPPDERAGTAFRLAARICDDDVDANRRLGAHGYRILQEIHAARVPASGRSTGDGVGVVEGDVDRLNVLTHCNAGWLATVDRGTATAGIYQAHEEGLPLHVWVDETRPRSQGGRLTAWELGEQGIPHTVIPDGAAAHLMARGQVDVVLVGTDRTTARGDVVNKIGTYPVALAARDNGIPFYVAAPSSSIDFSVDEGTEVPIEERAPDEVTWVTGKTAEGGVATVRVIPEGSPARNYAFDVTPARLVTGLVTERGVTEASTEGLARLFPERAR
ncbi:MAG: S-methyl-5-thioribose-1-phosphate isomerase [Gemmatimonadales bacterium]|nr:MAG: S-methyl-5-thioribose-1-phosphate isomerase [Gemmatimonadales bacterium]